MKQIKWKREKLEKDDQERRGENEETALQRWAPRTHDLGRRGANPQRAVAETRTSGLVGHRFGSDGGDLRVFSPLGFKPSTLNTPDSRSAGW